jgi:hypothetical protein
MQILFLLKLILDNNKTRKERENKAEIPKKNE